MEHLLYIPFVFALGACVGSFINVIVWRLPRGESIVSPPSHCPKCNTRLAWYDNFPVFGWIALGGKCRYCKQPISARYPIIEAITGGMFILVYVVFFILQEGPCATRPMNIQQDWPIYALDMFMLSGLLAASLIDAEHFVVPIEIPWIIGAIAVIVHTVIDMPSTIGSLNAALPIGAFTAGATIGLVLSIALVQFKLLSRSFEEGSPLLDVEKKAMAEQGGELPQEFSPAEIRAEMGKEMLFLIPPMLLGGLWLALTWKWAPARSFWESFGSHDWVSGLLGSLWGAFVGAFVIWLARIVFSIAFGREAMGLGDVHLMLGIGAVVGGAGSAIVFFIAPFVGLFIAIYKMIRRTGREVPFVPYLSIATLILVLFYCRIIQYLAPGMEGMMMVVRRMLIRE